jgi:PEP-CTERM motif
MKHFKAAVLIAGCLLSLGVMTVSARAATEIFSWTLIGPAPALGGFTAPGSGTLTVTLSPMGGDLVTSISGTVGGQTIAGLISNSFGDNLLFSNNNGTSLLDSKGISFNDVQGNLYNIFSFFAPGQVTSGNAYGERAPQGFGVGTFAISAVPEPATWAMMLLGFAGLGFAFRQTRRKVSFA